MSTSSLRRQVKNIVHNYSEAEIKVREATSNDPWGPSSSLMSEIADLTYNVVAFSEIMSMVWRRLNDHGKNWRHVYKALTLAEYLIKTGSERVAQQCRENVYAVQTLKDFQYVDRDGKDQGVNVREKAKQLVALLKDDEKLKEERAHALKTKEKLAQVSTAAVASASAPASAPASSSASLHSPPEIEQAWPQSMGEEELQLQLALAMSKEEADQRSPPEPGEDLQIRLALSLSKEEHDKEERLRRGDDLRLQMAIEESQKENVVPAQKDEPSLMDLADVFTASAPAADNDPWGAAPEIAPGPLPLALPAADPWGASAGPTPGPWGAPSALPGAAEAWGGTPVPAASDSWDALGTQPAVLVSPEPWASIPGPAAQPVTSLDPWAPLAPPPPSSASPALPETFMDPWEVSSPSPPAADSTAKPTFDPFVAPVVNDDFSDFDALRSHVPKSDSGAGEPDLLAGEVTMLRSGGDKSPGLFDFTGVGGALPESLGSRQMAAARKTPESFLGPNAALVDLDALVSSKAPAPGAKTSNPFLSAGALTPAMATNPFGATPAHSMTLNQLRASPVPLLAAPGGPLPCVSPMGSALPPVAGLPAMPPAAALPGAPLASQPANNTNPFLL